MHVCECVCVCVCVCVCMCVCVRARVHDVCVYTHVAIATVVDLLLVIGCQAVTVIDHQSFD